MMDEQALNPIVAMQMTKRPVLMIPRPKFVVRGGYDPLSRCTLLVAQCGTNISAGRGEFRARCSGRSRSSEFLSIKGGEEAIMSAAIESRFIEANGLKHHYLTAGSGPLVLLCHGFPELSWSWRHQIPALAAAGFRAVAPDLRGYGDTKGPPDPQSYSN